MRFWYITASEGSHSHTGVYPAHKVWSIKCLAQGQNAMPLIRLEPTTLNLKLSNLTRIHYAPLRPPDKSVYQKIIFLISQPKRMLWVLKRTVSMRRFFSTPKPCV